MRALLGALAAVLGITLATSASALPSPGDKAAAQALFDDALARMAAGSYAEACPKLEESQRLDFGMGTAYQLARCYEGAGRVASAWATYIQVADLARAAGQGSREKAARDRAAALEPRLSYLTVAVDVHAEGLEVRRGDLAVPAPQWGTRIPVDPGTYHLTASAPGRVSWKGEVTVGDQGAAVTAHVPDLAVAAPVPVAAAPLVPAALPERDGSTQRIAGIVTLGAGVVGIGVAGALGLVAKSNYDGANGECPTAGCTAAGKQATDSARALGDDGTVVFVVGAVAAATGAVVWLTAPRLSSSRSMGLEVGPASLLFSGVF